MNTLPVDRAMRIYSTLADRSETKGARERLSKHLMKKYIEGEKDHHRLTVKDCRIFAPWIGRSIPAISPSGRPAVFARSSAALSSPSRHGRRLPLLVFALVAAPSSPFRQMAS